MTKTRTEANCLEASAKALHSRECDWTHYELGNARQMEAFTDWLLNKEVGERPEG